MNEQQNAETKTRSTGRRGRKRGGDVLREIDPHGPALDMYSKLAFGPTADDPVVKWVRTWLWLSKFAKDLEKRAQNIAARLAGPAPTLQSLGVPPEHQNDPCAPQYLGQKQRVWAADAFTKFVACTDADAVAYGRDRDFFLERLEAENDTLLRWWNEAFANDPVEPFKKLAAAVEGEVEAERTGMDKYPLHCAILRLARMQPEKIVNGLPLYTAKSPVIRDMSYTLPQLCKLLEDAGLRTSGMSDENWQRRVRTAYTDLVLKPATAQARGGSAQKRLTPAALGLPANFGKPAFWRRGDLEHLLWEARTNYRRLLHRAHPDKGGNTDAFQQTRRLWRKVQNAFKRHGHELT